MDLRKQPVVQKQNSQQTTDQKTDPEMSGIGDVPYRSFTCGFPMVRAGCKKTSPSKQDHHFVPPTPFEKLRLELLFSHNLILKEPPLAGRRTTQPGR